MILKIFLRGRKCVLVDDQLNETELNMSVGHYLNQLCLKNGAGFRGRIESYVSLTGQRQKPAVLVSETDELMYFPTKGIDNPDCEWICYNHAVCVRECGKDQCEILYASGKTLTVNASERVVKKQIRNCNAYLDLLVK